MKILKDYPNTVKQIVDSLAELDEELEPIKCQNLVEIVKALPESFITNDDALLVAAFTPNIFVNRFKSGEQRKLSKKLWE